MFYFYRPPTNLREGNAFHRLSGILFTGVGTCPKGARAMTGGACYYPSRGVRVSGRIPHGRRVCMARGYTPCILQGACTTQDRTPLHGLTSQNRKSGWYASYWNTFLFQCTFLLYLGLTVWCSGC